VSGKGLITRVRDVRQLDKVRTTFRFSFPKELSNRAIDILAIGSLVLEQVIQVKKWPRYGRQDTTPVGHLTFSPGGCAVNVSVVCARLGGKSAIVSAMGTGKFSHDIEDELAISGVNTDFLCRLNGKDGNLVIILSDLRGDWTVMDFIDPELRLRKEDIPPDNVFGQTKIVHIDGYSYVSAGDQETIDICVNRAKQQGCLLSVDASVPAVRTRLDFTRELFERADFCFANQEEFLAITGVKSFPEAVHSLQPPGQKLWVIKQGSHGATIVTNQGSFHVPAFRVDVIDTIAAGDSFIAAFLTSLCRGGELFESALRGSAAGALACKGAGSLTYKFDMSAVDHLIRGENE